MNFERLLEAFVGGCGHHIEAPATLEPRCLRTYRIPIPVHSITHLWSSNEMYASLHLLECTQAPIGIFILNRCCNSNLLSYRESCFSCCAIIARTPQLWQHWEIGAILDTTRWPAAWTQLFKFYSLRLYLPDYVALKDFQSCGEKT